MPKPEKVAAVEEISSRLNEAQAVLLTEYRGLHVNEIAEVRTALRAAGADYKVLKNTLARIAVTKAGHNGLSELLVGPTAVAFCHGDAVIAAKALDDAKKRFPVLVIKGGLLRGEPISAEQAETLASLESREVLLARIAMLMNAPAQGAVNASAGLLRDLGSMLVQVVARKEESGTGSAGPQTESGTGSAGPQTESGTGSAGPQTENGTGSAGPQTENGTGSAGPQTENGTGSTGPQTENGVTA